MDLYSGIGEVTNEILYHVNSSLLSLEGVNGTWGPKKTEETISKWLALVGCIDHIIYDRDNY